MDVSIVVTCYNEERAISCCIDSLLVQDYSGGAFEIVVSDGGSRDATQAIVKKYGEADPRVRLVVEPKRGTAAGRNAGVRGARYGHIAFIDADCEAPRDWLSILVAHFVSASDSDATLAAVGGRNIAPPEASRFVHAIEIALDAFIGSFSSVQGRQYTSPVKVSSLATLNALYDKKNIVAAGCFDESLQSEAEDADLNYRLFSSGSTFHFVPQSFVWHRMRSTPRLWARNMFRYGKGRARLLKRYPQMMSVTFLLPLLFIASMAMVPFGFFGRLCLLPLLYFPGIIVFSVVHCMRKKAVELSPIVGFIYVLQHFSYALGELYGLLHKNVR